MCYLTNQNIIPIYKLTNIGAEYYSHLHLSLISDLVYIILVKQLLRWDNTYLDKDSM